MWTTSCRNTAYFRPVAACRRGGHSDASFSIAGGEAALRPRRHYKYYIRDSDNPPPRGGIVSTYRPTPAIPTWQGLG